MKARTRRLFEEVVARAVVRVGAHACVERDGSGRCVRKRFYPWDEFVRLAVGPEGVSSKFQEFGVDVVICPGEASGEELESLENLVRELREVVGWAQVYIPVNGCGCRR